MSGKNRTTWTPEQYREYVKKKAEQLVDSPMRVPLPQNADPKLKAEAWVRDIVLGTPKPDPDYNPFAPHRFTIPGDPVPAPRMTQRDKWQQRPCVVRYREWKDKLRGYVYACWANPSAVNWTAYFSMPKSWSKAKKEKMRGQLHRQKPDRDNIDKAILDALFTQDCVVAQGTICKRWDDGNGARLELEICF